MDPMFFFVYPHTHSLTHTFPFKLEAARKIADSMGFQDLKASELEKVFLILFFSQLVCDS